MHDDFFYGGDPTLWQEDIELDGNFASDSDDMRPNDEPLYQNQEQDPEVQRIQYEYDQYLDNLIDLSYLLTIQKYHLNVIVNLVL